MAFTEDIIQQVWEKAKIVDGYDHTRFRKDVCGAWIKRDKHGVTDDIYGWEIDHVYPQAPLQEKGIAQDKIDNTLNLRPMQWENNRSKSDNYPHYSVAVIADENKNIYKSKPLIVNEKLQKELGDIYNI